MLAVVLLGFVVLLPPEVAGQAIKAPCTRNGVVVPSEPLDDTRRGIETGLGHTILLVEKGEISCVGKIEEWLFVYRNVCDVIRFQVWRPLTGSDFRLVGENRWDGTACENGSYSIPAIDMIPVEPGDIIGWHQETDNGIFMYDEGLFGSTAYGEIFRANNTCTNPGVNTGCTFPTRQRRDYSIQARIIPEDLPTFTNLPNYDQEISEDSPVGTSVYTVRAVPRVTWSDTIPQTVTYKINSSEPDTCKNMFMIDPVSGVITFQGTSDKNHFPTPPMNYTNPRECNMTIIADIDGRWEAAENITIHVTEANTRHTISGSRDAILNIDTTGTLRRIFTINVDDALDDKYPSSIVTNKNFILTHAEPDATILSVGRISRNRGEVVCTNDLRFWSGPTRYLLEIMVSDDLYTDGPVTLQVNIVNLRRPPHLVDPPGHIWLYETTVGPREICNVFAEKDPISDRESVYDYSLIQYPRNEPTIFILDKNTTKIYLDVDKTFDYKRTREYHLEVTVTDTRMGYTDKANLTVDIIRVNQEPRFTVTGPVVATIPEEMALHSPIPGLNMTVYDRDLEFGDTFTLRIQNDTYHEYFYTKLGSTQLFINQRIDIDPSNPYMVATFDVYVHDRAGTTKIPEGIVNVTIYVTDINDNSPSFTYPSFSGAIVENTQGRREVGTFRATDRDWGQNARVTYSIQNENTGAKGDFYFQVDPYTGNITVKHPIDDEEHQSISFKLVATDGGSPPLSGHMDVFMSVTDVNDNRPTFTRRLYNVEVPSYVPTHTTVTIISALDPDTIGKVTYHFLRPTTDFNIAMMDGHVTTARWLTSGTKYLVFFYASDGKHTSDPAVVRVDAFDAGSHLIDVRSDVPLNEFDAEKESEFIHKLQILLAPWIVKIWKKVSSSNGGTLMTVYAVENNITDYYENVRLVKYIVHRDMLLSKLRSDRDGTPSDILRGPDFAPYRVTNVSPSHANWITETTAGNVTLAIILIASVLILVGATLLALKRLRMGPFTPRETISPRRHRVAPYPDEFKLNYKSTPTRPVSKSDLSYNFTPRVRPPPLSLQS